MTILIDNKGSEPIYEQIYRQLKAQILSGELKANELLPSIRALAKDLRISFITTKRAYDELEKDGFLYSVQGKGSYVAPKNLELEREENLKRMDELIDELRRLAACCGLEKEELLSLIRFAMEDEI